MGDAVVRRVVQPDPQALSALEEVVRRNFGVGVFLRVLTLPVAPFRQQRNLAVLSTVSEFDTTRRHVGTYAQGVLTGALYDVVEKVVRGVAGFYLHSTLAYVIPAIQGIGKTEEEKEELAFEPSFLSDVLCHSLVLPLSAALLRPLDVGLSVYAIDIGTTPLCDGHSLSKLYNTIRAQYKHAYVGFGYQVAALQVQLWTRALVVALLLQLPRKSLVRSLRAYIAGFVSITASYPFLLVDLQQRYCAVPGLNTYDVIPSISSIIENDGLLGLWTGFGYHLMFAPVVSFGTLTMAEVSRQLSAAAYNDDY